MNRREFLITTSAAMAVPGAIAQTAPAPEVHFPFGAHLYREPSQPQDQVLADLPLLKSLGFNMVKVQQSWSMDEQREGEIDLSHVDRVVAGAKECGLLVYFGVTLEQAPAWLWRKFPDAHMVYEDGQPHNDPTQYVLPANGKPGPCWHHPGAREAGARFLDTVGKELGKYENIRIWNVNPEIGFGPMRPDHSGFCYCRYTLVEYRKWLRSKYNTLQALNETWRTGYSDWEEIDPPRLSMDVPSSIDWRYFMDDVYMAQAQQWKTDVLRKADPLKRRIMAHMASAPVGSTSVWRYAETVDTFGASSYPAGTPFHPWDASKPVAGRAIAEFTGRFYELMDAVMMRFDYIRCASKRGDFWTAELQGGPVSAGMKIGRIPDVNDIRRWVLGSLAAGARGLSFWNLRPERMSSQGFGYGLLNAAGDHTPRADEAGRLAKAIEARAELFAKGPCAVGRAAIAVDEPLYHFLSSSGLREHLAYNIRGIYRALWDNGVPVDFVETQRLNDGPKYRAVILPFPLSQSLQAIRAVKEYVENGGTVISGPCPSRFSKYGFTYPDAISPVLQEVFGAGHSRLLNVREPNDQSRWTGVQRAYGDSVPYADLTGVGDFEGKNVAPALYVQTLRLEEAKPVLMRGEEAVGCVHTFGKGTAYLIGTLLGHAQTAYKDPKNADFLMAILAKAGVRPDMVGKLQRRRRAVSKQQYAWFFFNTTPEAVEEVVPVEKGRRVADLLGAPLEKTEAGVRLRVEPLDVRCLLLDVDS